MFVELPEIGSSVTQGEAFGVVESVKVRDPFYPRELVNCPLSALECKSCSYSHFLLDGSIVDQWLLMTFFCRWQAASDVYAPVSGEVLDANSTLAEDAALVRISLICFFLLVLHY